MRLLVLTQEVDVSEQTLRSDKLFGVYDDLASSLLSDFDTKYEAAIKDLKNSPSALEDYAWGRVTAAAETILGECLKAGVFDQDLDGLIKVYAGLNCGQGLTQQLGAIDEKISAIFLNEQELDAYRRARRQGRSRVIGGGFGVGGAAEGMALAGVANAATSIASGAFNLLAKAGTTALARNEAQETLRKTKPLLKCDLSTAIRNLYSVHLEVLQSSGAEAYDTEDARLERCRRAAVIFENSRKATLDPPQFVKNVLQCLSLDPRGAQYYHELLGRILAEKAGAADVSQLQQLAYHCAMNFEALAKESFERFANAKRDQASFANWAAEINQAASVLGHDHVAYANRAVAERFLAEVVRVGLERFLQDHALADTIIGLDASRIPCTRPGVVAALRSAYAADISKFAKDFAEATLAGDSRCINIADADSVIFVLQFLNRRDTTMLGIGVGSDAFQSAKEKLIKGKFDSLRSQQLARALVTFSDYFFADAAESKRQIEAYVRQRERDEDQAAQQRAAEMEVRAREAAAASAPPTHPPSTEAPGASATAALPSSAPRPFASKRKWVACALALPLGVVGAHRLYLRSWAGAGFYLAPFILLIVLLGAGVDSQNPVALAISIWILLLPAAALVDILRIIIMNHELFACRYEVNSNHTWRVWL
jgi:hypothetical protein